MKTSAKLLFLMASMAFFEAAIATESVLENKVAEGQAKTFFSSGGNYYLALNTTYLIYYGVLLGLALLALLALAPLFGGSSADSGYGYQHYQQRFGQENPNSDFHQHQRQRRGFAWDSDVAGKMAQLENAFKKYQVEEAECEMYIACEASQVNRHEANGPLAKQVYDILSEFNRAKDGHKWDDRISGLVQAFEYGSGAYYAGQTDACQPLRNKCFELHSKKNY